MSTTYRLEQSARSLESAPDLDRAQRAVVDHVGGPLLVLAGPGTGKTTTLVESVVDRVEHRGLDPDAVLVLTFSRRAADDLRQRVMRRLGRTSSTPMSSTFHSFCYALLRRWQPADLYAAPMRLLSAPEQDVRLRDLLRYSPDSDIAGWPGELDRAVRTRGFAREVHAVLSRARELGMEPRDLARVGEQAGRQVWAAAGAFMEEYLTVLDFEGAIDYSELIHRAVLLAESPEVQASLRRQFRAVFVDEYQDTDPSQVRLLRALAGDGRDLTVVGDPDQSIYAFRGADVRGILEFPDQFRRADGRAGDVVALGTTRRFGWRLLAASRRIAAGIGINGSIDRRLFEAFRNPVAEAGDVGGGTVDVFTFSSSGAETDHIADLLRRSHLEDGVPWGQMAVLVRSGVTTIPGLRRALVAGGVPVEVAADELPLRAEPAVQPLLTALRGALDVTAITPETAHQLLLSPLVDLDAAELRRLGRLLRRRDRDSGYGEQMVEQDAPDGRPRPRDDVAAGEPGRVEPGQRVSRLPRSSAELLRLALVEPGFLTGIDEALARGPRRLAGLLAKAHRLLADGGAAEQALWILWAGTSWPRRLRRQVERGAVAARAAHRDLDAMCALFEVAARAEEQHDHTGALVFLDEVEAQQIPADTLADRGVRGDAVRVLTAHRSKGLEWRVVVVAGVQEGSWPDVRRRGSLLQADRLGRDGLVEPVSTAAMLAEERRLFYVAVTRARERLVVTAVASPEADGDQPSRLLGDLGLPIVRRSGRPSRQLTLPGVVAELRRVASDANLSKALRGAAAARLAALADDEVAGQPVAASADPATWWGLRDRTDTAIPVRPPDEPLGLSASALGGILDCPLRWFLSREAAGESARGTSLGFGSVIHALADHMGKSGAVSVEELRELLDSVWDQLDFDSPWIADRERIEADKVIERFARWHQGRPGRTYLASEVPFSVEVALPDGDVVSLRGKVDRVERDTDGNVVVVDFKTSKNPPSNAAVVDDAQLGVYQLVVDSGGLSEVAGPSVASGGAELVQLRHDSSGWPKVQAQPRPTVGDDGRRPVEIQLTTAAQALRAERFPATANGYCQFCDFAAMCPSRRRSGSVL